MRPKAVLRLLIPLALLVVVVAAVWPRGAPAERSREAEMRDIARVLACPVCQGLSVADSPAPLATQMRQVILEQLAAGASREQIIQFFVERYGEGILFDPPKRGFGLLIWWVPVLAVLGGGSLLGLLLARWVRRPGKGPEVEEVPLSPADVAMYQQRLAAELRRQEGHAAR